MRKELIPIEFMTPGSEAYLSALHFGDEAAPKVYIQASLHADELPGSLASYYLHQRLLELEQQGRLRAHIVLVPFCNPLGLTQSVSYAHIGRFHLSTGQNFNRLFTVPLKQAVLAELQQDAISLGADAQENTRVLRALMTKVLQSMSPSSNVHSLHLNLLRLSHDADIVLDLHCDNDSVMHLYTLPSTWGFFEPLARHLGSQCQMVSEDSSASSFDEILSTIWLDLQKAYPDAAIEQGLYSSTVELRGEYDLSHDYAQADTDGILQFLHGHGYIALDESQVKVAPALINPPHPLEGLCYVPAPISGIVVYHVKPGQWVEEGQHVADVVDPICLRCEQVFAPHRGFVFATSGTRLAIGERKLMSISCPEDIGHIGLSP